MIETRLLRYFLAVAEALSITKAADILHVTQPTLSKQLMELEQQVGKKLLIRGNKTLTLTEDGLFLRTRAKEILALLDQTETSLRAGKQLEGGVIHVGIADIAVPPCVKKALQLMHQTYPSVQFHLYNESKDTITEKLNTGLLDMAFVLTPTIDPDYDHFRMPYMPRWGILSPTDHPLAQKDHIILDDLYSYPLIYPYTVFHTQSHPAYFPIDNKRLNISLVYNRFPEATLLTDAGFGIAYTLEDTYAAEKYPNLTFLPVQPEIVSRFYLLTKKGRKLSHAATVFVELLLEDIKPPAR